MRRSVLVGISVFVVLLLSGLGIGLYFAFRPKDPLDGKLQAKVAVATATEECTDAAVSILKKGGSAVDSAITATLCQGLTVPQSSGLGGGFIAIIYNKKTGTIETLNAREVAPLAATKDMYEDDLSSREGGLSVAVPTELKGLHELHKKYGKLTWEEIVQPVIEIAENGFTVTNYLATILVERGDKIRDRKALRDYFTNPQTGEFYKRGDLMTNLNLAKTLKVIAKEGADSIYSGGLLAQSIVREIQDAGGIITIEDLKKYEPKWGKPVDTKLFNGETLYNFPLPATGSVINFIINVLKGYKFEEQSFQYHNQDKLIFHRLVEAMKFAFAKRTKLGDENTPEVLKTLEELESPEHADYIRSIIRDDVTFNDFEHYGANNSVVVDHGTGHISILAPNGDAVSLTSTINFVLGSFVMSESMGIVYNNQMNDFSIPVAKSDGLLPAPANYIAPEKSPISSMSPIIVLDENKDVSMVLGGAGGILIMTSVVQFLINFLYLDQSIETSITAKRLHHQLQPMHVRHENGYDPEILRFLKGKGHETFEEEVSVAGFACVVAITKKNGMLEAAIDPRRGGKSVVF